MRDSASRMQPNTQERVARWRDNVIDKNARSGLGADTVFLPVYLVRGQLGRAHEDGYRLAG